MTHVHASEPPQGALDTELVDAVMRASRVFVGVASRSLAAVREDVTLPQFRVLVLVASRGPQRSIDLAAALTVNPSSVTRLVNRLRRAGLVRKDPIVGDGRSYLVELTRAGRDLVVEASRRRREEFEKLLAKLPSDWHQCVIDALRTLGDVAGEPHEYDLAVSLGRPLSD